MFTRCDQRAFGFDKRVIQLNYKIGWDRDWPAPHLISKVTRFVVEAIWVVVAGTKSLGRRLRRSRVVEANIDEEKSPAQKAMGVYQRKLEHIFGSSEWIYDVMWYVRLWTDGE